MESDEPNDQPSVLAIVHLLVVDTPSKAASGYINADGEQVLCTGRPILEGDLEARENAFRAFRDQVSVEAIEDAMVRARTRHQAAH